MVDLNTLNYLQFLHLGNNETEGHPGVVYDQLDGLSSQRGTTVILSWQRLLFSIMGIHYLNYFYILFNDSRRSELG
jgi:hypothetical protein